MGFIRGGSRRVSPFPAVWCIITASTFRADVRYIGLPANFLILLSKFMYIPTSMRALQFARHDPHPTVYEVVNNAPAPIARADEVIVRVRYAALNRLDDWVRIGWPGIGLPLPHIPGSDFSGEIAWVGEHARDWRLGQMVTANNHLWCGCCAACNRGQTNQCESSGILGESRSGTLCEYVAIPARNLIELPEGFDLQLAAAASLTYVTAWHSLIVKGQLELGERVLIVGAGGGVNVAAQQIALLRGAEVYVIASNATKAEQALAHGADWVCDRSEEADWSRAVWEATHGKGVDMVVDNVGAATLGDSLKTLTLGGRVVTVGGTSGYDSTLSLSSFFLRHLSILGSTMGTQADYKEVMKLVFAGRLQPVIDRVVSPRNYPEAIRRMQSNQHYGKIVVDLHNWE